LLMLRSRTNQVRQMLWGADCGSTD
jgi:hypothetical protein